MIKEILLQIHENKQWSKKTNQMIRVNLTIKSILNEEFIVSRIIESKNDLIIFSNGSVEPKTRIVLPVKSIYSFKLDIHDTYEDYRYSHHALGNTREEIINFINNLGEK